MVAACRGTPASSLCFLVARTLLEKLPVSEVTKLLEGLSNGDAGAADRLLELIYGELRSMAAIRMSREQPGHTLQPTALVHEAWLRLMADGTPAFKSRAHFFSAAGEAMRRILVEDARRKSALKRDIHANGEPAPVELTDTPADQLLNLDGALELFAKEDPLSADLVKLRYFAGMTMQEAAEALDIPLRRAERLWAYARAWLRRRISQREF